MRWENDGWIIQREFDWADYVNEYWDEALNMNDYDRLLYGHIRKRLVHLCPQYWENPALYTIQNEEDLKARDAHLRLRNTRFLRLDALCLAAAPQEGESSLVVEHGSETGQRASPLRPD